MVNTFILQEDISSRHEWSPLTESNCRPFPYHGNALPTELRGRSLETNFAVFQSTSLRSVEASHSLTQFIINTQIGSSTIIFPPFKSTLEVIRQKGDADEILEGFPQV